MESEFDLPLRYRIRVWGVLEPSWLSELVESAVTEHDAADRTTTLLSGCLTDQPALVGLINTLYNFGLTIESIRCDILHDRR